MSTQADSSADQLIAEGMRLGLERDFQQAVEKLSGALVLRPNSADAHFNLGVALQKLGRTQDAVVAFERTVALSPDWCEAQFNLANGYRDCRRFRQAAHSYQAALTIRPHYLKALYNFANLCFDQGRLAQAERLLKQAINVKGDYAEALYNLGRVYRRQGRSKEAVDVVARAVGLEPANRRYQTKLAEYQRSSGDVTAALKTLADVLQSDPGNPSATSQLAVILRDQQRLEDAVAALNQAILLKRANVDLLWLRADVKRLIGQFDDALADLEEAVKLSPESVNVHNLMGAIWFAKGSPEAAIHCYERALGIQADHAEVQNNLGAALQALRRYDESTEAFHLAVRLKPDFAVARLNLALALLREGNFLDGWREFEWRFMCPDFRLPPRQLPTWTGEDLEGQVLLIRCEQGLGDTFQFIRYAAVLKKLCAKVIVECQPPLVALLAHCPGIDLIVSMGESVPDATLQIPLMSVPAVLKTTLTSVPANVPYIHAAKSKTDFWRDRLAKLGPFVVGIAWQGNKKFQSDHFRSLPVDSFKPLGSVPGIALVSLQKYAGTEQLSSASGFAVRSFGDELDRDQPFVDTTALIAASDLVITSDTAIAHLAGALGKPVWVALSYSPDWRWLETGETNPWYPTMRIFRQPKFGDWKSVFQRMARELNGVCEGNRSNLLPRPTSIGRKVQIETSPGDLIDRITILEIKQERLQQSHQLDNVRAELRSLSATADATVPGNADVRRASDALRNVNRQLWDVEEQLRAYEQRQEFGPAFTELARSVYRLNDLRAEHKRFLNDVLTSQFQEEKSYVGMYTSPQPKRDYAASQQYAATAYRSAVRSPGSNATLGVIQEAAQVIEGQYGRPPKGEVGIVIGHFENPDFLALGLSCIRKHCGNVPVLVADDCSSGFAEHPDPNSIYGKALAAAAEDGAMFWPNAHRAGHVRGDLSAVAKGIIWASRLRLKVLFKLSQRLIFDQQGWLETGTRELLNSNATVLGRGCTHFGWKIRTESLGVLVESWNRPEILSALWKPLSMQFAENLLWEVVEKYFDGKLATWTTLSPNRQQRQPGIYFRATHSSAEYGQLARSLGINPGCYPCGAAELEADYQP